nr:NADH dehydrogenase subunit 2 [Saemundssonia lari]
MILATFCSVSSSTWLGMWGMMELVMFSFLPVLLSFGGNKHTSLVGLWKYFVAQTFSSIVIVTLLVMGSFSSLSEVDVGMIVFFGVMVKVGMVPFHGWSFHLAECLSKTQFFMMNSALKIPPLGVVSSLASHLYTQTPFIFVLSGLLSASFLLSNLSLMWSLMASSTYMMSWMMVCSFLGKGELSSFFILYAASLLLVLVSFPPFVNGLWVVGSGSLITSLSLFSLMGPPPSGVFWGKVGVVSTLLESGFFELAVSLLILSALASFFYMKFILFNLTKFSFPMMANFGVMVMSGSTLLLGVVGLTIFVL